MKLDSVWKVVVAIGALYVGFHIPEIWEFLKTFLG